MGPVLAVALPPVAELVELLVALLELVLVVVLKFRTATVFETLVPLLPLDFLPPTTCSSWSSVSSWIIRSSYIDTIPPKKIFLYETISLIWLQGTIQIIVLLSERIKRRKVTSIHCIFRYFLSLLGWLSLYFYLIYF